MASSSSSSLLMLIYSISVIAVLAISIASASGEVVYSKESHLSTMMPNRSGCRGTVAECMMSDGNEEEFELDSEYGRRILATTTYISYGALQRNTVPCSLRGQSYYNCKTGAAANPYTRGCSAITQCRS